MDAVLPLVCLLVGIALPLLGLWLIVRRGARQLASAEAYRDVARAHGLLADTRGSSLHGWLDGRRIWIGDVLVGHGGERRIEVRGILGLKSPLGLGLSVRKRGRITRRSRRSPLHIDDPVLDKQLEVRGDHEDRIKSLFDPRVKAALLLMMERWPKLTVTDDEVRVQLKNPESTSLGLDALLRALVDLAGALETSRASMPHPPLLTPTLGAWRRLAERRALVLKPELPAVQGHLAGHEVLAVARRSGNTYAAEVHVHFREHRETGIRIRPQVEPDGYWNVGQDIQVGDAPFDAAFVVKGWDPAGVRALLNPAARRALTALLTIGPVDVDDRGIHLRSSPLEADELDKALDQLVAAATAIGW